MQTGAGGRGGGRRKRAGGRENPRSPLSVPGLGGGRCPQVDAVPGPFPPLPPPQLLPGRRCCSRPAPRPAPDPLRFCSAAVGAAPGKRGLPPALPCPAGPRRLRGRGAAPGPSLHCLRLLAFNRGLAFGGAEGPRWQRGGRVPHPRSSRLSPSQRLALQRWVRRGGTWKPVTCFFWGAGAKLQRALCMLKPPQLALLEVNVICSCRRDDGKRDAVRWGSSFEVTEAVADPMEVKPNLILGPPCCVTAVRFPAKALTFG